MKIKLRLKNKFIPVNVPKLFSHEKNNVRKCLSTGWISSEGEFVRKFENSFSKYNNRNYGISVSSGTGALEIAVRSLNLKKGSEVIISSFTIISTALSVIKSELKPIDLLETSLAIIQSQFFSFNFFLNFLLCYEFLQQNL